MTVATLMFIYDMLKSEEESRRKEKADAFRALEGAESAKSENVTNLRQILDNARKSWQEAQSALSDFENREW